MGPEKSGKKTQPLTDGRKTRLESYFHDALSILGDSIDLAKGRKPTYYRVVALQLRLLLCDTTRAHDREMNISLVPQLYPELTISSEGFGEGEPVELPLKEWLELPAMVGDPQHRSIRKLIRQICDLDGGAHVGSTKAAATPRSIYNLLRIAEVVRDRLDKLVP
jgi:hypothetical protein